jgi:hypothetical protein
MGVTEMKRAVFLMVPALLLSTVSSASAGGGHKHGFVGVSGFGVAPVGFVAGGFAPVGFAPVGYSPVGFSPVGYSSVGFAPVGFAPVGYVGAPVGVNSGINAQGVLDQLIFEILRRGINNRIPERGIDANLEARLARIEARLLALEEKKEENRQTRVTVEAMDEVLKKHDAALRKANLIP